MQYEGHQTNSLHFVFPSKEKTNFSSFEVNGNISMNKTIHVEHIKIFKWEISIDEIIKLVS